MKLLCVISAIVVHVFLESSEQLGRESSMLHKGGANSVTFIQHGKHK